MWSAPYNAAAIAADTSNNIYLTGMDGNYVTTKLTPSGSNVWSHSYTSFGPCSSQTINVTSNDDIYICGSEFWAPPHSIGNNGTVLIKYHSNGNELWLAEERLSNDGDGVIQINGSVVDPQGNSYFILNGRNGFEPIEYNTYAYSAGGSFLWTAYDPTGNGGSKVLGLAVDTKSAVVVTGQNAHYPPLPSCGTYKIDTNGNYLWAKLYPLGWAGSSVGTSVTVDKANNWYVTGYSPTTNTSEDIVTIAYDTNGKQLWLQRYDGSAHGDDEANAIALDGSGNIYVAGYETVAGGGTEMALIKYSPVILQHQSNGNFLLQAQGASGEPFDIQATTNLQTWLDLGTDYADTNGLLQYLDTNASHFPWRFYLAIPQ